MEDPVSHLAVRGPVAPSDVAGLARRIRAALAAGGRWLIVDLARAGRDVPEPLVGALAETAAACRERRGELVVTGAPPEVAERLSDPRRAAPRPALAASVDQAVMILRVLRPKTKRVVAA